MSVELGSKNLIDIVGITQDLVRIPSYVSLGAGPKVTEQKVADYICDFLDRYTQMTVRRQLVGDGRYNIIASTTDTPKLLLLGHLDTVRPSVGGNFDPFGAEINGGKLYGLGSTDMKSGVAAILSAVARKKLKDTMLMFYVDEEYDFLGMNSLIKEYTSIRPELMVSGDGGDCELGIGCRGLIEVHGVFKGRSAHASRPDLGLNAIYGVTDAFRYMADYLGKYEHPVLGESTVNLARLDGGKLAVDQSGQEVLVEQINSVPDFAKFKVDIRSSSPDLTAEVVAQELAGYARRMGYGLDNVKLQHNLGAWYTDPGEIEYLKPIVSEIVGRVNVKDPKDTGYIDLQMLWDKIGRPPAVTFGPGPNKMAHQVDEYVEVDALLKSQEVFYKIVDLFQR